MMMESLPNLWAKTSHLEGAARWHPLLLHMLDVAATADAVLAREPARTRERMADILGLSVEAGHPWLLLLIACHDLGKACPGFQCKWQNLSGLEAGRRPNTDINHAFVSQIALSEWLWARNWPRRLARKVADAVGCHHGERCDPITMDNLINDASALGGAHWTDVRHTLVDEVAQVLGVPADPPDKPKLTGPDFMLLAGLASFADWIGSNEDWFAFGDPADCSDPGGWYGQRRMQADEALNGIGWYPRTPLSNVPISFSQAFSTLTPRPLQQAVEASLSAVDEPTVLLVEAPMGEGKTEAAFYAHLTLQRQLDHRGLYVAMPTKATGNAMFDRTLGFLRKQGSDHPLDLQLLHGAIRLNESFQQLRLNGIYDQNEDGSVRTSEWFTSKKRALLSEYGVGTIDQALLTILPVRHQFVPLWGLANRVVVFDEIHAYDAYTGTLLVHLVRWLLALGSSVVMLSATLPPAFRRQLADIVGSDTPQPEAAYPRLTTFRPGTVEQVHFAADPSRRLVVEVVGIRPDLPQIHSGLMAHLADGGMGLALVNTVQRAQDLYRLFPRGELLTHAGIPVGKRLDDGTEIYLFHARFPAESRQTREDRVLALFGRDGQVRDGRKILIATQVAEQSLDLDFDLLVTDLAPIDLILQRAGRLWRHPRKTRPLAAPTLLVAGLAGNVPPEFGDPLWWGAIYREDILLSTWCLLQDRRQLTLPDEIDLLVQAVYEEAVEIPTALQERFDQALTCGDGDDLAKAQQARLATIGFPDDGSWDDVSRFTFYDEDDPAVHRTLVAQTRLGAESVTVIPLWPQDNFDTTHRPSVPEAIRWLNRTISLSRKSVVGALKKTGVPKGWQQSSLLRNIMPLTIDENHRWSHDKCVRLDSELGLVYEPKEAP